MGPIPAKICGIQTEGEILLFQVHKIGRNADLKPQLTPPPTPCDAHLSTAETEISGRIAVTHALRRTVFFDGQEQFSLDIHRCD